MTNLDKFLKEAAELFDKYGASLEFEDISTDWGGPNWHAHLSIEKPEYESKGMMEGSWISPINADSFRELLDLPTEEDNE